MGGTLQRRLSEQVESAHPFQEIGIQYACRNGSWCALLNIPASQASAAHLALLKAESFRQKSSMETFRQKKRSPGFRFAKRTARDAISSSFRSPSALSGPCALFSREDASWDPDAAVRGPWPKASRPSLHLKA